MLDKKCFSELGAEVKMMYRKLIFDPKGGGKEAKDVHGINYDNYKNPNDPNSYGSRKKAGKLKGIDGTPQDRLFQNSKAPVMTGELMNKFQSIQSTSRGFGFGAITERGKIKHLANMGREVTTNAKPVPDEVAKFIMKELTKDVKGAFKKIRKKIKRKKININIGK